MATADANTNKVQVQRYKPDTDPDKNYLNIEKGIKSWLTTTDHKRIGILYLCSVTFFFFVGGILALLLRTELLTPTQLFVDAQVYNLIFTVLGTILDFLLFVPVVPR